MTYARIQRGVLFFWGLWFAIVTLTNLCDAGVHAGVLPPWWGLASGNYALIGEVTGRYSPPRWLQALLFGGVIAWEALVGGLFLRAWIAWPDQSRARRDASLAYGAALGLWAGFLLADEICIAYALEAAHIRLFIAHAVCLVAADRADPSPR